MATTEGLFDQDNSRLLTDTGPLKAIAKGSSGLWLGSLREGVLLHDSQDYGRGLNEQQGFTKNHVADILYDDDGYLWFALYGHGFVKIAEDVLLTRVVAFE